jgi:phosphatidylglycerol:prolipoprotein diacylglycerol transferase
VFPYVELITWKLGRHTFPVFATLVLFAVALATVIIVLRGRRRWNLPAARLEEMCLWAIVIGFVGAHLFSIVYRPDFLAFLQNPSNLLLVGGIASFGGFFGGLAGIWGFFLRRRMRGAERWKYLDTTSYAIPFSWIFGRVGCALVHDHPGIRTTSWLGVRFPGGTRYDLGLLEVLFLAVLAVVFFALDRRPRVPGFFFAAFFVPYGVFRLVIDQLHVDPPRYLGITVDQYASSAAVVAGVAAWMWMARRGV